MSGVCVCTARPPCSVAGRATYLAASPGALRSGGTWFAEMVVVIALDWVDAAAALALAQSRLLAAAELAAVVWPWVLQQVLAAALLPVG